MRLLVFATIFTLVTWPALAQYPETGGDPDDGTGAPKARPLGDPGASQDAEAARQKLLKASDQIDQVAANSETTRASLEGLKTQLNQLQADNTALKAQVSTLQDIVTRQQDALDQLKAARTKDRQAIIDEVATLVASKSATHHAHTEVADSDEPPAPKKHLADSTADSGDATPAAKLDAALSPPPDASSSGPVKYPTAPSKIEADTTGSSDTPATPTAPVVHHKGYYHVVAPHETLSMICEAYRDHGVNVTVAKVRKANGLTSKSALKTGQKLFIPKPGT